MEDKTLQDFLLSNFNEHLASENMRYIEIKKVYSLIYNKELAINKVKSEEETFLRVFHNIRNFPELKQIGLFGKKKNIIQELDKLKSSGLFCNSDYLSQIELTNEEQAAIFCCLFEQNCIWILLTDDQFFEAKLNLEDPRITIFRYLQDINENIVFLIDDLLLKNFHIGGKNIYEKEETEIFHFNFDDDKSLKFKLDDICEIPVNLGAIDEVDAYNNICFDSQLNNILALIEDNDRKAANINKYKKEFYELVKKKIIHNDRMENGYIDYVINDFFKKINYQNKALNQTTEELKQKYEYILTKILNESKFLCKKITQNIIKLGNYFIFFNSSPFNENHSKILIKVCTQVLVSFLSENLDFEMNSSCRKKLIDDSNNLCYKIYKNFVDDYSIQNIIPSDNKLRLSILNIFYEGFTYKSKEQHLSIFDEHLMSLIKLFEEYSNFFNEVVEIDLKIKLTNNQLYLNLYQFSSPKKNSGEIDLVFFNKLAEFSKIPINLFELSKIKNCKDVFDPKYLDYKKSFLENQLYKIYPTKSKCHVLFYMMIPNESNILYLISQTQTKHLISQNSSVEFFYIEKEELAIFLDLSNKIFKTLKIDHFGKLSNDQEHRIDLEGLESNNFISSCISYSNLFLLLKKNRGYRILKMFVKSKGNRVEVKEIIPRYIDESNKIRYFEHNKNSNIIETLDKDSSHLRNYRKILYFKNEKFILQSDNFIDLFDREGTLHLSIPILKNQEYADIKSLIKTKLKIFSDEKNEYLLIATTFSNGGRYSPYNNSIYRNTTYCKANDHCITNYDCYMFKDFYSDFKLIECSNIDNNTNSNDDAKGNPIIDILYLTDYKFGPLKSNFIGIHKANNYFLKFCQDEEIGNENKKNQLTPQQKEDFKKKILDYESILYISNKYEIVKNDDDLIIQFSVRHKDCNHQAFILLSRLSFHILTINNRDFKLLSDEDKELSSQNFLYHRFPILEKVMKELEIQPVVVGIMGKQSGGKSYLFNRCFGTRFSVSGTRCTDGIWMSLAKIEDKFFIILDSEGLFSARKSETEELKLLTFLFAITDVVILNQDNNFNRNIIEMLNKISSDKSRHNHEENLFKSKLYICSRDVDQKEKANNRREFERVMTEIDSKNTEYLKRFFGQGMSLHPMVNFKDINFDKDLKGFKDSIASTNPHWRNSEIMFKYFKIFVKKLSQDDNNSPQSILKSHEKENLLMQLSQIFTKGEDKVFKCPINIPESAEINIKNKQDKEENDTNKEVDVNCSESSSKTNEEEFITFNHQEINLEEMDDNKIIGFLSTKLQETYKNNNVSSFGKNFYDATQDLLKKFFDERLKLVEEFLNRSIAESKMKGIDLDEFKDEFKNCLLNLRKEKIFELCLKKCTLCYLKCKKNSSHTTRIQSEREDTRLKLEMLKRDLSESSYSKETDVSENIKGIENMINQMTERKNLLIKSSEILEKLIAKVVIKQSLLSEQEVRLKNIKEWEEQMNNIEISADVNQENFRENIVAEVDKYKNQLLEQKLLYHSLATEFNEFFVDNKTDLELLTEQENEWIGKMNSDKDATSEFYSKICSDFFDSRIFDNISRSKLIHEMSILIEPFKKEILLIELDNQLSSQIIEKINKKHATVNERINYIDAEIILKCQEFLRFNEELIQSQKEKEKLLDENQQKISEERHLMEKMDYANQLQEQTKSKLIHFSDKLQELNKKQAKVNQIFENVDKFNNFIEQSNQIYSQSMRSSLITKFVEKNFKWFKKEKENHEKDDSKILEELLKEKERRVKTLSEKKEIKNRDLIEKKIKSLGEEIDQKRQKLRLNSILRDILEQTNFSEKKNSEIYDVHASAIDLNMILRKNQKSSLKIRDLIENIYSTEKFNILPENLRLENYLNFYSNDKIQELVDQLDVYKVGFEDFYSFVEQYEINEEETVESKQNLNDFNKSVLKIQDDTILNTSVTESVYYLNNDNNKKDIILEPKLNESMVIIPEEVIKSKTDEEINELDSSVNLNNTITEKSEVRDIECQIMIKMKNKEVLNSVKKSINKFYEEFDSDKSNLNAQKLNSYSEFSEKIALLFNELKIQNEEENNCLSKIKGYLKSMKEDIETFLNKEEEMKKTFHSEQLEKFLEDLKKYRDVLLHDKTDINILLNSDDLNTDKFYEVIELENKIEIITNLLNYADSNKTSFYKNVSQLYFNDNCSFNIVNHSDEIKIDENTNICCDNDNDVCEEKYDDNNVKLSEAEEQSSDENNLIEFFEVLEKKKEFKCLFAEKIIERIQNFIKDKNFFEKYAIITTEENQIQETKLKLEEEAIKIEITNIESEIKNLNQEIQENRASLDIINDSLLKTEIKIQKCSKEIDMIETQIKEEQTTQTSLKDRSKFIGKKLRIINDLTIMKTSIQQKELLSSNLEFLKSKVEEIYETVVNIIKKSDFEKAIESDKIKSQEFENQITSICNEINSLSIQVSTLGEKIPLEEIELNSVDLNQQYDKEKCELEKEINQKQIQLEQLKNVHELSRQKYDLEKKIENLEKELNNSCDCMTDHQCKESCRVCVNMICSNTAGHESIHLCNNSSHRCPETCKKFKKCKNPCINDLKVIHEHDCGEKHQCKKNCKYCEKNCSNFKDNENHEHLCDSKRCPKKCILCQDPCAGEGHDHNEKVETIIIDGKEEKLHLCNKEHSCKNKCNYEGSCKVEYKTETRVWKTENSETTYDYHKPILSKNDCKVKIPVGRIKHEGDCRCDYFNKCNIVECKKCLDIKDHRCNAQCPQCGSICFHTNGHKGKHDVIHRNMEKCIYAVKQQKEGYKDLSTTERDGFSTNREKENLIDLSKISEISDKSLILETEGSVMNTGKKVKKYKPDDIAFVDICQEVCIKKGRGHVHLMVCEGGDKCAEKVYSKENCRHSKEKYYPDKNVQYDEVLCSAYWEIMNFENPNKEKEELLKEFDSCNFYCNKKHPDENHSSYKFCGKKMFHTDSNLRTNHDFDCEHPEVNKIQIGFLIDCTQSMEEFIEKTSQAVKNIAKLFQENSHGITIEFGVCGYRDHVLDSSKEKGYTDTNLYKLLETLDFTNFNRAFKFISNLKSIGGQDLCEAVVDGLKAVNELSWCKDKETKKIVFMIADYPPHGREFHDHDESNENEEEICKSDDEEEEEEEDSSKTDDRGLSFLKKLLKDLKKSLHKKIISNYDSFPNGCPCGLDYEPILKELSDKNIIFKLVKWTSELEKMIEKFKSSGLDIEDINVDEKYLDELPKLIEKNICECLKDEDVFIPLK